MADLHPDNPYAKDRFPDPHKTVEFPEEVKKRFDHILTRYPTKEAALLPTLHLVQETWGWISPEAVHYVSGLLDLSTATVFGVVSFYDMYNQKPVGKYRLPNVSTLDARFEKQIMFGPRRLSFDVDVFNLLNRGTVLGRKYDVQATDFNAVTEIMNPRIARFGVRFSF